MKPATGEINYELVLEVCKAILNAENQEEVEEIKTNLPVYFRENGVEEEVIDQFMKDVEGMLTIIRLEDLVLDENGNFVKAHQEDYIEEHPEVIPSLTEEFVNNRRDELLESAEVGSPAPTEKPTANIGGIAGNIFTVAAGAVVICLALKNKVFNKKKSEDREPWER